MKNIILIAIFILCYSCKSQKNIQTKTVGIYSTKEKGIDGKIILNADYSFIYSYHSGLINSKSEGSWKLVNGALVLNSSEKYLTNLIKVKESMGEGKITVVDTQNNAVEGVVVILNNSKNSLETSTTGSIDITNYPKVKSFEIHYLGEVYKYSIIDKKTDSYNVIIHFSDLNKTYFNNQIFKLKGKSITDQEGLIFVKK